MKNLKDRIWSMDYLFGKVVPVTSIGLGLVLMGAGVYITEEHSDEALALMGIGGTLISGVGGFLLGRAYEKESNKNTYQTKPEDYLNK